MMPPIQNCSLVNNDNEIKSRASAEEEWVTKKKVEITTTKNIETKVFRQLVLDDGRVLDEEVPIVTIDRTEDKQIFVTDHDEDRDFNNCENEKAVKSEFHTHNGVHVGDKFSTIKTTKDIKENVKRTEAVQDIGNIRSREVDHVLRDKTNIGKYIQTSDREKNQVSSEPQTVFQDRKHHIVTDKEDVRERNWIHGGKLKQERTVTEEYIEYDSDDSACSSSSSKSSRSSHYQLRPEEYKTRTEESFTEYFVKGKGDEKQSLVKLGDGPHYKSESKEGSKTDQEHWIQKKNHQLKQPTHKQLTQVRSLDNVTKKTGRHGLGSSGFSNSTNDLSRFRAFDGEESLRASSVNDVRGDDVEDKVYIAKVIQNAETPTVKMRMKKTNLNYYKIEDQNSSTDHPIRPPRTKEYTFNNCRIAESQKQRFKPTRPHSVDLSESYHFRDTAATHSKFENQLSPSHDSPQNLSEEHKHSENESKNNHCHLLPSLRHKRGYHSTQNLSSEHINHHQSRQSSNSHGGHSNEKTMASKSYFKHFPSLSLGRNYHSTQNLSETSDRYKNIDRPRSVNFSLEEPIKVKANYELVPSTETLKHHRVKNVTKNSNSHYHSTGNIYKSVTTERSSSDKHEPHHLSIGDVSQWRSGSSQGSMGIVRDRKSSGQLIFSTEKPKTREFSKIRSCARLAMPREESRIIPIEIYSSSAPMSPIGSPSTKYKTRVVVNGAA